ncbi:MAG: hypothetical protein IBJ15_16450, partial [Alphaproteobacteria bacterium]|nr:hypothetical protein [Alphaproteobacteria bacterium]
SLWRPTRSNSRVRPSPGSTWRWRAPARRGRVSPRRRSPPGRRTERAPSPRTVQRRPPCHAATSRRRAGFQGLLLSDDLSMKALDGDFEARTRACLDAGCDVVLHCNGDFAEMKAVAVAARPLNDSAMARVEAGERLRLSRAQRSFDEAAAKAELDAFLAA